jgi:4-amino-4-deoxy-L-arabinose transferase-like glycosyltransferase
LAFAIRIFHIGQAPLLHDEAYTFLTATTSPTEIIDYLKRDSGPPLYYFLLHYWTSLFGDSESALRLLSASLSLVLIGALFKIGEKLYSTEIGLMAALLAAVSPIQVHYSQQLRMYTLLPLLALASIYFLVRYLQETKIKNALLCALATVLGLYTHAFFFFILPAHLVLISLSSQNQRKWQGIMALYALVLVGYFPWLPILIRQIGNKDPIAWFAAYWNQWGPLGAVTWTLTSLSPGGAQPSMVDGFNVPALGRFWPTIFAGGLTSIGAVWLVSTRWPGDKLGALCMPVYLSVPLACSLLTSIAISPNYLAGRVDQIVLPAFYLMLAMGISEIPWPSLRALALATAVLMSVLTLNQS